MAHDPSDEPESLKYQRAEDEQHARRVLDNLERLRIELAAMIYRQTGSLPTGLRPPREGRRSRRAKNGGNVVDCAHLFRRQER